MGVSLEFLRGVLGVLCVLFGYLTGRSAAAVKKGRQKKSRLYGWVFRTAVCGLAVSLRFQIDAIDIGVWVLCLAAFALGWWSASQQREPEDLSQEMFK